MADMLLSFARTGSNTASTVNAMFMCDTTVTITCLWRSLVPLAERDLVCTDAS